MTNLLIEPSIRIEGQQGIRLASLPSILAALVADRVESFPALRAHQVPAWHMFLVQLGAVAMHRAGLVSPPVDTEQWQDIIRSLTKAEFPGDEPWHLVVEDMSKPAFLQPPFSDEALLKDERVASPDALDMLITTKNHDLKQAVAARAEVDDWIFSLVSLQTGEGYNGRGNFGVARMNGGSSSRVCIGLAPMSKSSPTAVSPRPGVRFRRDVTQLVARRSRLLDTVPNLYSPAGRITLTWTEPWPEGELLQLPDLDIFFIEVCRRVRLSSIGGHVHARAGNSKNRRINGEPFKGNVGDPWAPIHRAESKSLTLGENGAFDYAKITELLSADWELPLLATLGDGEGNDVANWLLIAQAIARGNSKTGGFKERTILLGRNGAKALGRKRLELHQLALQQIDEIKRADVILRNAVAIAATGGDPEKLNDRTNRDNAYAKSQPARDRLEAEADRLFFPALWERFEGVEARDATRQSAARESFVRALVGCAEDLLAEALDDLTCASLRRPRAQARALARFAIELRSERGFPEYFRRQPEDEDMPDAAA